MWTRRFRIGLAAGIAALAFGVPLAGAGNTIVDDYWRDQAAVPSASSNTIVDDYWRYGPRTAAPAENTIVDDYFRDAPAPVAVVGANGGFDWADFGIGAAAAVGAMLVLLGLATGVLAVRQSRSHGSRRTGTA